MQMLANLKPNEKRLVGAAALVIAIFLAMQFLGGGDEEAVADDTTADAAELEGLQAKFDDYRAQLERAPSVLEEYNQLEARLPRGNDNRRPDLAFSDQLAQLCSDSGFAYPRIEATKISEIDDVNDYELLSAMIITDEGSFADTARLLRIFQNNGLIVRELDMSGTKDQDRIRARVTVSRIAPVPEEETSRRRRRRS